MHDLNPFQDEAASRSIGDLTIENRLDQIELYGSLSLTRDKAGLALAKELKDMLDAVVAALQAEKNLPEHIPQAPTERVDNPFGR